MGIEDLRKKLKPVPVAALEEQDKQLDETLGKKSSDSNQLKFDVGRNTFRIYPPHEPLDKNGKANPFAEPKVVVFLPAMVAERDKDGKPIEENGKVKLKLGVKPVFNAKVHGHKDRFGNALTKDLVEEYIRMAEEKAATIEDKDKREQFLIPIVGFFSRDPNKRVNGITYRSTWEMYCEKIKGEQSQFGKLEIGKAVKNRLNKIAAIESANEPLGTDPFTDLDEGRAIVIIYNDKAEKPEDYYTTEIDNSTVEEEVEIAGGQKRKMKVLKTYPITDNQLDAFSKVDSLESIYRYGFKRRDLDLQLTGLKMLDDKYKLGIFDTEEFQSIAAVLTEQYPVEEEKTDDTTDTDDSVMTTSSETSHHQVLTPSNSKSNPVKTDLPFDKDTDIFTVMTREELKEFNKDNSCGVLIKPASIMSDDDLRDALREWQRAQDVAEVNRQFEVQQTVVETPEVTERPLTPKERLEALKKKQQSGN